jgi:hypothetical protein
MEELAKLNIVPPLRLALEILVVSHDRAASAVELGALEDACAPTAG